jgi:hypothetical protein
VTGEGRIARRLSLVTRHSPLFWGQVRNHLPLAVCLLLSFVAALPLFSNPGFLNTRGIGDSPNLLFRVQQLITAFAAGEFPARWMPDAAYGYGMPYFTYYASFSTHLAALLKVYGFSYVIAIKLAQLLALLVAAGGMYGWLRSVGLAQARSSLASIAYTVAPFHLINLYIRGDSLAELWAMAVYPLVLWAAQRCHDRLTVGRAFALALAVAALICTHNISALNFLPFVALYFSALRWRLLASRFTFHASLALLWGLALSAFFWLPALGETQFVQLGDLTQGFFFYGNHFRSADLVQTSVLFDYDRNPFSLGLVQTALALLGLGVLMWRTVRDRRWSPLNTFTVIGLAVSTLMITPLSQPLWENIPLLRYTQFPWRFLSIQALFTAVMPANLLLENGNSRWRPQLQTTNYLAVASLLALSALLPLRLTFFPLNDSDVSAERLNLYEYFTTAIGNTVNSEYLPREVRPRPFTSAAMLSRTPEVKVLRGGASGERVWKRGASERWTITVTGAAPAAIAVPTHYWPGWEAQSGSQPLAAQAAESLGWLSVELPPGPHTVTFTLGRTPLRLWAEVLSVAALSVPLGIWVSRKARPDRKTITSAPRHPRTLALCLGALALGAFVLRAWPNPPSSNSPLSMDFETLAFPHHDPIRFGAAGELRRVMYSADRLRRGDTLTVKTEWALNRTVDATFRLATPFRDSALPLPFITVALNGPQAEAALPIPPDLPPGLYFVTVELRDKCCLYPALTADGRPRGLIHLAPVSVDDAEAIGGAQPPLADFGALRLVRGEVAFSAGDTLTAQLTWQATRDISRNYALAVRVRDEAGNEWGSGGDPQPVRGLYPTALWRPGEVVTDTLAVTLNGPGEPPGDYRLAVTVYDGSTLQPLGTAEVPFALNRRHPREGRAAQFTLTSNLQIEKIKFPTQVAQGDALLLSAFYLTGAQPNPRYRAQWSLQSRGAPVAHRHTSDLAPGSPTSEWPLEAWLVGQARLPIPNDLAPGEYALAVQLIDAAGNAVGEAARVGVVTVTGRARDFTVPPVQTAVGATFDGQLKLIGYDSAQIESELTLTLVWQALAQPRGDYKYFVHLFNPVDGFVVTQADAVPRNFTYPTTLWVQAEVVTETVRLALTPGRYQLAVGWYDPAAPDLARLPAFDANGALQDDGRVVLPTTIERP